MLNNYKYLKNKEKLYHMVENDSKFHRIGQKAGRVLRKRIFTYEEIAELVGVSVDKVKEVEANHFQ